jgi:hypothetical protein
MNLYFDSSTELAYPISYWKKYIQENEKNELELTLAKKVKDSDYFFCEKVSAIGEKGNCGKVCEFYSPINGKSGICKHYKSNLFEETSKKIIIKK